MSLELVRVNWRNSRHNFLLILIALFLASTLAGCATIGTPQQEIVSYTRPSAENLQNIKIARVHLTKEMAAHLAGLPKDQTEFGSRWLIEEKPDTMRPGPWNTHLYIFTSTDTNNCLRIDLLDHDHYEVHHNWLNEKMLFVRVPWGRIAWTEFIVNTETTHFAYIEDGMYIKTIEQQEAEESRGK